MKSFVNLIGGILKKEEPWPLERAAIVNWVSANKSSRDKKIKGKRVFRKSENGTSFIYTELRTLNSETRTTSRQRKGTSHIRLTSQPDLYYFYNKLIV